jgi:hypothetical protein
MPTKVNLDLDPNGKKWIKNSIDLWLVPCFTFAHLDRTLC